MSTAPRITDKPFNFLFPTSSTTSIRSPNAVGDPSSQPFRALHFSASPSPPQTSLVYQHVMQHADDPMTGVTKFECTDYLNIAVYYIYAFRDLAALWPCFAYKVELPSSTFPTQSVPFVDSRAGLTDMTWSGYYN
ncbi:hypothetical protein K439DRAFT_1534323 [Ramaria rubella]|nr:hypothetical protein K439DRAFT_1534323 [Ramaria rubella]